MGFRHAGVLAAVSFFLGKWGFPFSLSLSLSSFTCALNNFGLSGSSGGGCDTIFFFNLGVLFIAFNVDRRILYSGSVPTEEDYVDAFKFYTTFYEAPLAIKVSSQSSPPPLSFFFLWKKKGDKYWTGLIVVLGGLFFFFKRLYYML